MSFFRPPAAGSPPATRVIVIAVCCAAFGAVVICYYLNAPVFATWARMALGYTRGLLWFAVLAWAAYAGGDYLVSKVFRPSVRAWEISWALGWVAFGAAATLLAAAGVFYGWIVKIGVGVLVLCSLPKLFRTIRAVPAAGEGVRDIPGAVWAIILPLAPFYLSMALRAGAPPADWDALVYHLYLPKVFCENHGFVYLPRLAYVSMPLGAEMTYAWAYQWGGLGSAGGAAACLNLLLLAATYRLGRVWLDRIWAVVAAALVAVIPSFAAMSTIAYVDAAQGALIVLAVWLYFRGGRGARDAAVGGILLGAALAMKYTGVYALVGFGVVLAADALRRELSWRYVAVFLGVACLVFLPWPIKAWAERGNPVFPAMYGVFGGRDLPPAVAAAFGKWQRGMGMGRGLSDYLLLPYRLSFMTGTGYGRFDGHFLAFAFPAMLFAPFIFKRWRLWMFAAAHGAAWAFIGSQQLRFLTGVFGLVAVLAAGVLQQALTALPRGLRRAGAAVAFLAVGAWAFGGNGFLLHRGVLPLAYFLTGDADAYLAAAMVTYDHDLYINEKLPPDAKVLYLFDNTLLYKKRAAVVDSFFEASETILAVQERETPAEVAAYLNRLGVTHIVTLKVSEDGYWRYYEGYTRALWEEYLRRYTRVVAARRFGEIREVSR